MLFILLVKHSQSYFLYVENIEVYRNGTLFALSTFSFSTRVVKSLQLLTGKKIGTKVFFMV